MRPQSKSEERTNLDITVRPLEERDLPAADYIMRLAFGTFIGLTEPTAFMGDASYVITRWLADPNAAFAAEIRVPTPLLSMKPKRLVIEREYFAVTTLIVREPYISVVLASTPPVFPILLPG